MNKQHKTKKALPLAIVMLTAIAALSIISGALAVEDHEITTVVVLPTTGGTTSLSAGNHSYANATVLTISATPNEGFEFLYWNITGIMNTAGEHSTMAVDQSDMEHEGPFGKLSDLDSLILTEPSVTITIDCAYTYQYQAFFAPNQNTSTDKAATQQLEAANNNVTIYAAVGIVAAVAGIAAVGGVYLKRKKTAVPAPIVTQ